MDLQTNMQFLATLACAIFAGAAIYINLVEHPARMSCGTELAAIEWAPSYKKAALLQAPLAILGFLCAVAAWLTGATVWWLVGGLLLGLVVPFTLIGIMPTNKRLMSADIDLRSDETRQLLKKWNRLHAVRSILSLAALVIFLLNG